MSLSDGLGFRARSTRMVAAMLTLLDGQRTLADVAAELARSEGTSPEAVAQALLTVAGEMLGAGFLAPA